MPTAGLARLDVLPEAGYEQIGVLEGGQDSTAACNRWVLGD